jgi:hypothetical protein
VWHGAPSSLWELEKQFQNFVVDGVEVGFQLAFAKLAVVARKRDAAHVVVGIEVCDTPFHGNSTGTFPGFTTTSFDAPQEHGDKFFVREVNWHG